MGKEVGSSVSIKAILADKRAWCFFRLHFERLPVRLGGKRFLKLYITTLIIVNLPLMS